MISIEQWPPRLNEWLQRNCSLFRRATVLRQTGSTQDAARRMGAQPGDVVTAWRQTAGRGRMGRTWLDTGEDGLAVTLALQSGQSERLAVSVAIGVAMTIESLLHRQVSIKWPNDVELNRRKLAGILIEQNEAIALVGVGINVRQTHWPEDLADHAVSLKQLGCDVDRVDVLLNLLPALEAALRLDEHELSSEFAERDALRGARATFSSSGQQISGIVLRIDPCRGLLVATDEGETWLPAAHTSVLHRD